MDQQRQHSIPPDSKLFLAEELLAVSKSWDIWGEFILYKGEHAYSLSLVFKKGGRLLKSRMKINVDRQTPKDDEQYQYLKREGIL